MTLKQESFDILKNELQRRVDKVPQVMGFDAYGVTAADMGLDADFIDRLINEAYLGIFTTEEAEEMIAFQQRFADRTAILEKVVEEAVGKVMEANKENILKKLQEGAK